MEQALNNASQARSVLRDAIYHGVYPPGSSLPSTRRLAQQFGINRNTATRIYHELAEDALVELPANRPPIVRVPPEARTSDSLHDHVRDSLQQLLLDCRLAGMSAEDTRRLLNDVIDDYFSIHTERVVYVAECNEDEAHWFAQELTLKLGMAVQPILISQLDPGLESTLVLTPYFHLAEVRAQLGYEYTQVQGLVVAADGSDIVRVASSVSTGPLGVVAIMPDAAERLRNLLSFQINVPMISASTDDPATLEGLRDQVECVACTPRASEITREMLPGIPLVVIQYQIDPGSLETARQAIESATGPPRIRE
jgi:DNA-binding transcriptional regulator YhcF (GntR family)